MTSSTSGIGVRETAVTFLTQTGPSTYVPQARVFDLEIEEVAQATYAQLIKLIMNGVEGKLYNNTTKQFDPSDNTAGLASQISVAAYALNQWSKYKYIDSGGKEQFGTKIEASTFYDYASPSKTDAQGKVTLYTMNRYMAEDFDKIIRVMRAAGWDPVYQPGGTAAYITARTALTSDATKSIYGWSALMTKALDDCANAILSAKTFTQSQSIQQLLMVDYVSRGNQLLFDEMTGLKDAIDINEKTLSYLNSLQDLMNQKDPAKFLLYLDKIAGSGTLDYTGFESSSFNQEIKTTAKFTPDTYTGFVNAIAAGQTSGDVLSGTVAGAYVYLDPNNASYNTYVSVADSGNDALQRIINNLTYLKTKLSAVSGSEQTVLSQRLDSLIHDFNSVMPTSGLKGAYGILSWVQDYNQGREGDFQKTLSDAVVASQALNDVKREDLRRVMFVYEEFYKSATAMLSRLTQLIERMAGTISR